MARRRLRRKAVAAALTIAGTALFATAATASAHPASAARISSTGTEQSVPLTTGPMPPGASSAPGAVGRPFSFTLAGPSSAGSGNPLAPASPQNAVVCTVTAWQPDNYAHLRMSGYGSIICTQNVDELQLQECMQNLVTGGWQTTICLPGANSHYTAYGTNYIDGETIFSGCVQNRWYRMWAWGWAYYGNTTSGTDTSNGTQCQ